MSRADYEVLPMGDEWLIRMAGDSVSELLHTKSEAIRRARELGRGYDQWHIRVLLDTGALESELSSESAHA